MIIQCNRCSTKFRLDDSRVTGAGVRVKCTKCQNIFLVTPPEETPVEEILSVGPAERPGKDRDIPKSPEGPNLSLDLTPSAESSGTGTQEEASSDLPQKKPPVSFDNLDFSFSVDGGIAAPDPGEVDPRRTSETLSSPESEDAGWGEVPKQEGRVDTDKDSSETDAISGFDSGAEPGKGLSADESPFKDFDFGEPEPKVDSVKDTGPLGEDTYGLGSSETAEEERPEPIRQPSDASPSREYTRQGLMKDEVPSAKEPKEPLVAPKDTFSRLLSESLKKDIKEKDVTVEEAEDDEDVLGFEPEEDFEADSPAGSPPSKSFKKAGMRIPPALIALIVFLIGGGIIYFSGIIETIARRLAPAEAPKSVEIEDVKGSYVDNQVFGKFFVIEARLKNISDEPQSVKRVTGIVYGKDGEKIMSLSVAPGRVVTPDDLKILPKEELARQFKDPSGGSIPPKGTVPVMVIFTDISSGVSEAGVDIVP